MPKYRWEATPHITRPDVSLKAPKSAIGILMATKVLLIGLKRHSQSITTAHKKYP